MAKKLHVKKGDNVIVNCGEYKGTQGKVLAVYPKNSRALVEGINMISKHTKPSAENPQGGIVEKSMPVEISNMMLMCNHCVKPTRVGIKELENGKRVRVCKKCNEQIDS